MKVIANASTSTPLGIGGTFTSPAQDVSAFASVTIAAKSDKDGVLYADFSPDGSNWDSTLTYQLAANTNEVHRLTVTRAYFRVRVSNTSGEVQGFLRVQCMMGDHANLVAPLSLAIQDDADASVVRAFGEEFSIARGGVANMSIVNKFGRNTDVDTASVPEDVWNGGGAYAGFPTGAAEEFEVFSSSASDTGVLTFTYLPSFTSEDWVTATVTLNGTTPVNTGVTGVRMHTANYSSGASTTFNVGTITVRHRVTTANQFCLMPIGRSQTNVCAYTAPAGSTAYLRRLWSRVIGSASGQIDGALWIRSLNGSPRLRRPFTATSSVAFEEYPYGGLVVSAGSDITVRISSASANNLDVVAGFDLVVVKN